MNLADPGLLHERRRVAGIHAASRENLNTRSLIPLQACQQRCALRRLFLPAAGEHPVNPKLDELLNGALRVRHTVKRTVENRLPPQPFMTPHSSLVCST